MNSRAVHVNCPPPGATIAVQALTGMTQGTMGAYGTVDLADGQTMDAVFASAGLRGFQPADPGQGDNAPPQYSAMVLTSSNQWAFQSMSGSTLIPAVPCSDDPPGPSLNDLVTWARVRQSDGTLLWPWPKATQPFNGLRSSTAWGCPQPGFFGRLLAMLWWLLTFQWLRKT
jgi:hypothetical protein